MKKENFKHLVVSPFVEKFEELNEVLGAAKNVTLFVQEVDNLIVPEFLNYLAHNGELTSSIIDVYYSANKEAKRGPSKIGVEKYNYIKDAKFFEITEVSNAVLNFLLIKDNYGNYTKISDTAPPSSGFDVCWNWGDPSSECQKTKEYLNKVETISGTIKSFLSFFDNGIKNEDGITLYEHQEKALEKWFKNECKGIFKLCTGAGKTFTSIFAIKRVLAGLSKENHPAAVVITVPFKILGDQWYEVLKKLKMPAAVRTYKSKWRENLEYRLKREECQLLITTYTTFCDRISFLNFIVKKSKKAFFG